MQKYQNKPNQCFHVIYYHCLDLDDLENKMNKNILLIGMGFQVWKVKITKDPESGSELFELSF